MSYWCQKPQSPQGKTVLQLITAIKYLSWDDIGERLKECPDDASEIDKFGVTALHHAIRKRHCEVPIQIIRSLVAAHPGSLELSDNQTGFNALHLACMKSIHEANSSYEIVALLLESNVHSVKHLCKEGRLPLHRAKTGDITLKLIDAYPEGLGVESKSNEHLPLHDACSDNVQSDVVKILIDRGRKHKIGIKCGDADQYCGGVLKKDIHGDIPLKILFRRIMFSSKSTKHGLLIDEKSPLWIKLCIVAKATYLALRNFPQGWETDSTPLVHAIVECGGHPSIVQHVLAQNPEEIYLQDDRGRAPLSVAASKVDILPEIIEVILKNDKNGASAKMKDVVGRLPLHLAVETGRTWNNGVDLIVNAAPEALQTRDLVEDMYPFMQAAIPTFGWDNSSLDTIYTLLRHSPDVIENFCRNHK